MTSPADPGRERKILLCYDGSPESERALARVAEAASAAPSRVTVISVAEPIYGTAPYTGYADPGEEQAHRRLLEAATKELARHGIDAATTEPTGETGDAIVALARELGIDMIVVGSRHRPLVERLLFGSVSAEVVLKAPCDVLVVR